MTYHIHFYAPDSHLTAIKTAMFTAGAGRTARYTHCAWQALGEGQFRPAGDDEIYFGQRDLAAHITEYRVEMMCADSALKEVIAALKAAHPYEDPTYAIFKMVEPSEIE